MYYDIEVTGWLHVTPDIQIVHLSRLIPVSIFYARGALERQVSAWPRIRVRDGTEEWVYSLNPRPTSHPPPL